MNSAEILDRLIGSPMVSRASNLELIAFARKLLAKRGIGSRPAHHEAGEQSKLYAKTGAANRGGRRQVLAGRRRKSRGRWRRRSIMGRRI